MEFIYHYTNINTLALILKNKTIRFNRLDRVDDISESEYYGDYDMSKFLFVSSWTDSAIESIPLWHMYTNEMKGVKICFNSDWMYYRELKPDPKYDFVQQGKIYAPIPFDKFYNNEYFILPNMFDRSKVLRKIKYVADPGNYFKHAVEFKIESDGHANMKIKELNDFATYKQELWAFQEEVRFVLFILPSIPIPPDGFTNNNYLTELPNFVMRSILNGVGPNLEYFDVDINPEVLDKIEVTLGPLCDSGDEILVDSLLKTYTKNGHLKRSNLTGTIRKAMK